MLNICSSKIISVCKLHSDDAECPSPSGVQPALITPPKVERPIGVNQHALVKPNGTGVICEACSSIAPDMETLSWIPCSPSDVFQSKGVKNINDRLEQEHQYLKKLRKLRLLEVEMTRLQQLKEQKQKASNIPLPKDAGSALLDKFRELGK